MKNAESAILFIDVAGSTTLAGYDRGLLVELTQQMVELLAADALHFTAWGDSALAVFEKPDKLYEAIKELSIWWREYPTEAEAVPEGVGLRGAVHVGSVTTLKGRAGAVVGAAVNFVGRLAAQAPVDSLLLTPRAYKTWAPLLRHDRVRAETRIAYVPGEKPTRAYELRLDALSTSPDPIIRFAPPTDLLLFLASQPDELFHVTPRRFEELMAELLGDFGYQVQLTKQTRDDGIDIIAIGRSTPLGLDERYLIQCKRNAPDNRVGVSVVRDLLGVGSHEPNTGLMIVTTSTFSSPAKKLAFKESVRWRLHLRDYDHISEWLRAYAIRRRG